MTDNAQQMHGSCPHHFKECGDLEAGERKGVFFLGSNSKRSVSVSKIHFKTGN